MARKVRVALAGLGSVSQRGILPHLAEEDAREHVESGRRPQLRDQGGRIDPACDHVQRGDDVVPVEQPTPSRARR